MANTTTETGFLDRFFEVTKRGSTLGTEFRGGLVIFMTMVYIIILNPIILAFSPDVAGNVIGGGAIAKFAFAPAAIASATALTAPPAPAQDASGLPSPARSRCTRPSRPASGMASPARRSSRPTT